MTQLIFLPLTKADEEKRLVRAYAAVEEPDKAAEIMDYASAVPQFKAWSKQYETATLGKSLGNIRAMHNPRHLAGKVTEIAYDDTKKAVEICIKVLDPVDWTKVEEGGYTGMSIGGGYLKKWKDQATGLTRYTPRIGEISFVDSPCISSARILELQKIDGSVEEVLLKGTPRTFSQLLAPPTFGQLHKASFPKLLNTVTHVALGADSYVSRGKTFNHQNLAEKVLPTVDREVRGKKLSTEVDAGHRVSYTSRGKTFTSGEPHDDSGLERAEQFASLVEKDRLTKTNFFLQPDNTIGAFHAQHGDQTEKPNRFSLHQNKNYFPGLAKQDADALHEMADQMQKAAANSAEGRAKVQAVMHEFKHGGLRSYRGINPRTGKPRQGPKVNDRQQAIAIALSQARRMGKTDPAFVVALADRMMKRGGDASAMITDRKGTARYSLPMEPPRKLGPAIGGVVGGVLGAAATRMGEGAALGALGGVAVGDRVQAGARALRRKLAHRHGIASLSARIHALSDKERAQRVAAAKARWAKEGHPAIDDHHQALLAQAKRSILGRAGKVAAVHEQIAHNWHAVADAQDAYDKMRPHVPKQHKIMMEVPHAGGLLYNPDGIGTDHFHPNGAPKSTMYMMHPAEVDDWIAKYGKGAKAVRKEAPFGAVEHIDELFQSLEAPLEAA